MIDLPPFNCQSGHDILSSVAQIRAGLESIRFRAVKRSVDGTAGRPVCGSKNDVGRRPIGGFPGNRYAPRLGNYQMTSWPIMLRHAVDASGVFMWDIACGSGDRDLAKKLSNSDFPVQTTYADHIDPLYYGGR